MSDDVRKLIEDARKWLAGERHFDHVYRAATSGAFVRRLADALEASMEEWAELDEIARDGYRMLADAESELKEARGRG